MDIAHIREFIALADMCNYKKAANHLFISQTTLFNHMKALENEFGFPLFTRVGKGIALSEYGKMFQPYAKAILGNAELFKKEAAEFMAKSSRRILIGSQYRITNLIQAFKKSHDSFTVYDLCAGDADSALYQSGCDLAFIRNLDNSEGKYHTLSYVSDPTMVAVPPGHPLSSCKAVSLSMLKDEQFIAYFSPRGEEIREMRLCEQAGFRPQISVTVANGSEAAKLVHAGLGITFLQQKSFLNHNDMELVLLPVDPPITCEVSLCWRRDKALSGGALAFVNFVKAHPEIR